MKISALLSAIILVGSALLINTAVYAGEQERMTGRGTGPVIYVTSQGLYYDSIVLADLPNKGNFQKLEMGMYGLQTEFGPGDPGHLGGRWWLDLNGDEEMNSTDKFFLCPLLGPGRDTL